MAPESVLRLSRQCTKDIWSAHSILVNDTSTMTMLKEISSNRNFQTMDVIAPCSPSWSTRTPHLVPLLLEPVFRYIATLLSPHLTLANITQTPQAGTTTATNSPSGGLVRHGIKHDCLMPCWRSLSNMGSDRMLLKIFERPHNSQTIGPMSYELIGQWLFDMGSNTLSNPTLKKSVKQPCPTWDRTEWSNPITILSNAVSDTPTGWVFFSGELNLLSLALLGQTNNLTCHHNCRRTTQTVDANGGWHNIDQTGLLLGGTPDELVQYQLAWKALPTSWYQLVQLAGRYSRPAGTARWEVLPTSWYSSLGGNPNQLVQLAGRHSRRAGTVPTRWEALILKSWYSTNSLGGTPEELVQYQLAGRKPDELVQYQLAGGHSRRADTVPARWEALLTSWYSTNSLGGTPDELVQYQLAGRHSRQSGTVPTCWEALPTSWCTSSSQKGTPDQLAQY
ncbi:hypothetical protein PCANC_16156 [Puccinia coronata f. sp. avenae]|uniref:Glutaminase A central domain-containing protein n=1 Tax=Puccinia coronata f. sp. avenae TaxID=200324 RepID=A0A2N5T0V5_9BASI|nr:hypothetical protein PCANC_16156 [Puccinia coronata f. sp. avenae]